MRSGQIDLQRAQTLWTLLRKPEPRANHPDRDHGRVSGRQPDESVMQPPVGHPVDAPGQGQRTRPCMEPCPPPSLRFDHLALPETDEPLQGPDFSGRGQSAYRDGAPREDLQEDRHYASSLSQRPVQRQWWPETCQLGRLRTVRRAMPDRRATRRRLRSARLSRAPTNAMYAAVKMDPSASNSGHVRKTSRKPTPMTSTARGRPLAAIHACQ